MELFDLSRAYSFSEYITDSISPITTGTVTVTWILLTV
jgi:hypothetical protein